MNMKMKMKIKKTIRMPKELLKKWLEALRSGKYKQGKQVLQRLERDDHIEARRLEAEPGRIGLLELQVCPVGVARARMRNRLLRNIHADDFGRCGRMGSANLIEQYAEGI